MEIKRYCIIKGNKTDKAELEKYFKENSAGNEERIRIGMEGPSEIIICRRKEDGKRLIRADIWHNRPPYDGRRTSYIGNIEIDRKLEASKDDILLEAFNIVLEEVEKEGVQTIIGPLSGTTWNSYRYVTERGERPPFLMEPYQEGDEAELLIKAGFRPFAYYLSSICENIRERGNLDSKLKKVEKLPFYKDIKVESAENKDLQNLLGEVYEISVEAFKNNFLYTPIKKELFLKMYMKYEERLIRKFFKLVYIKGKLAGYAFAIPDYMELGYKGKIETLILKTMAVSPEYNGKGLGYVLISSVIEEAKKNGYENIIYALMHRENVSKNMVLLVSRPFREYALFKKEVNLEAEKEKF